MVLFLGSKVKFLCSMQYYQMEKGGQITAIFSQHLHLLIWRLIAQIVVF